MTLSRTIKISNYSYAGEWRILAPWLPNARTTPAQPPAQPPWEAGVGNREFCANSFSGPLAYWQHRWTRQHHWKSWGRRGAYTVMDDAI
jgi:hypothetical protein